MNQDIFWLRLLSFCIVTFTFFDLQAQSDIKVNGIKINHVDKQKRKQGDWIFFDKFGNVRLSCVFQNDSCVSPLAFYENSDTVFVRFPTADSIDFFTLFNNKKKYFGSFIYTSDSTSVIEVEPDSAINDNIILEIKKYQNVTIEPIYFFSQKKLIDYISASFTSSNFIFNKPLNILLTISSSGFVTNVEFPKDKNNLSGDEERELYLIYSTMPRWQPFFYKNQTRPIKIMLSNNSTLSILSFDH